MSGKIISLALKFANALSPILVTGLFLYSDGTTILSILVNADGDLIVSFTNGSYANLGKIGCVHSYSAWSVGAAPTCASLGYNAV